MVPTSRILTPLRKGGAMKKSKSNEWQNTFDAIDDWICIIDLKSAIQRSNLAAEKLFGLNVKKIVGKKCCSLVHCTETQVDACPLPKMIKSGRRESAELQINDRRWVLITVDPLFDHGKMVGAVHIARDVTKRIEIQNERERLFSELQVALDHVKQLNGLLPICAQCKKIRDDKGYWKQIEEYITEHSQARFTHGICQECSDKLYGDKDWYNEMKWNKKGC